MLAIAKRPWPTLTLAFVMIGQNRQASFRQAKADHDFEQEETEPRTGTRIVRGSLRADADIFSFPSGHAASAFAFAYAVARDQPRLAVPIWLLAGAVAHSRVLTGVHYPSDVVLGFVLGAGTAAMVTSRESGFRGPRLTKARADVAQARGR